MSKQGLPSPNDCWKSSLKRNPLISINHVYVFLLSFYSVKPPFSVFLRAVSSNIWFVVSVMHVIHEHAVINATAHDDLLWGKSEVGYWQQYCAHTFRCIWSMKCGKQWVKLYVNAKFAWKSAFTKTCSSHCYRVVNQPGVETSFFREK